MSLEEFKHYHAKTIAQLWSGIELRYGVSESEFAERLYLSVSKAGELTSPDRGTRFFLTIKTSELCLVMGCERGDEAAWLDFDTGYRQGMHAAARALTRDDAEAEDLTQSLMGDLYGVRLDGDQRSSKFQHYSGRGSLGGWLRAVVYQCFIDRKRRTTRLEQAGEADEFERLAARVENPLVTPAARPDQIEDDRLRHATEEALAQGLAALDERDRLLLNYYFFKALTLKEIGVLMRVHEATISRWLQRALKQARQKTEQILQRDYGLRRAEVTECLQLAAESEIDVRRLLGETETSSAGSRSVG